MPNSASEELKIVKTLIDKGKIRDTLQLIKNIEKIEDLTPEERLRTLYYKGRVYIYLGQPDISFEIAEQLYQKSQKIKHPLFSLDAFTLKIIVLYKFFENTYSTSIFRHRRQVVRQEPAKLLPSVRFRPVPFIYYVFS